MKQKTKVKPKPKIIVVLGQTATGKSDLGVELAKEFGGEIVSADSRQVYKGLDIGTGKVPLSYESCPKLDEFTKASTPFFCEPTRKGGGPAYYRGIRHHLLDVVSPKKRFTVAEYKKKAQIAIDDILARGKVPIVVGGTGFYIQAIVDGIVPPEVPPDPLLREKLKNLRTEELMNKLEKLDPERALTVEQKNPRRLIRAIEIAKALGKVPKIKKEPKYDALQIGLRMGNEKLKKKIEKRLLERIDEGMIGEAKHLHEKGLSWKRMEELGLEYRYLARHLQGKLTKEEMIKQLNTAIWHYARRQKTWFKRDPRIHWFTAGKKSEMGEIVKLVKGFVGNGV